MSRHQFSIVWIIVAIFLLAIGWNMMQSAKTCDEGYERESNYRWSSQNGKCAYNYRLVDDTNWDFPAGRDRCGMCSSYGFDPSAYEYYCPHNARQYGVSLCDQGRIM